MSELGIKLHLIKQSLEEALKTIGKPQELLSQLQEDEILQPGETTKIGQLALEAEESLDAFIKGFGEFSQWLEKKVVEGEEGATATESTTGGQSYTPVSQKKKSGNDYGFGTM